VIAARLAQDTQEAITGLSTDDIKARSADVDLHLDRCSDRCRVEDGQVRECSGITPDPLPGRHDAA